MKIRPFFLFSLFICASIAVQAQMPPPPPASPYRTYVSVNGNDSNMTMGCQQIAPCRNFQAALNVTTPHGEVTALDSGDYMPFNINQSVTIKAAPGADVTILTAFGDAITINYSANPLDSVVLRGLTINGSGTMGWNGVHFFNGGTLIIENCVITDFGGGIRMDSAGKLTVTDTILRNNFFGATLQTTYGQVHATFDHVQIKNNMFSGLGVWNNTHAVISNSLITDNFPDGIEVSSSGSFPPTTELEIEGCVIRNNITGINAYSGLVRVSHSTITDNGTGIAPPFGAQVLSFGNNRLMGNGTDGSFSGMISLQ